MTRPVTFLALLLCALSLLAAGALQAQMPGTDLMKKAGDLKGLAGPLDLNSASLADLKKLPGIGDLDAQKIIGGRPFSNVTDLVDKKIVSQTVFDQIKGLITVK